MDATSNACTLAMLVETAAKSEACLSTVKVSGLTPWCRPLPTEWTGLGPIILRRLPGGGLIVQTRLSRISTDSWAGIARFEGILASLGTSWSRKCLLDRPERQFA